MKKISRNKINANQSIDLVLNSISKVNRHDLHSRTVSNILDSNCI